MVTTGKQSISITKLERKERKRVTNSRSKGNNAVGKEGWPGFKGYLRRYLEERATPNLKA
ncbi:hypothetical protein EST38_g7223 [Candolleomyces aberdarensis]|uniref:Uncharacterized protein n=1 Tax=Candolleomyces aberdarensis TaxID=2316362 RepID=A0A4Q2DHP7_9AGAR|nr:hypothetical protein EST38_g7223 [Candolleomyces aberdarensis]